ncbi:MAG: TolC family protein, partial [Fibrobacteres bacterium]|nr:TolC family protein [Fibrobacterota bacterium]
MFLKYALLISILTLRLYAQETVTIQQAIENALKYNGNIKAVEKEKDAVKSEISQAGRFQNPEVEVETENLGSASTSVSVIMPVELGGKRKARIMKARADSMLLSAEYESYRASVVASVHRQFYKALGH